MHRAIARARPDPPPLPDRAPRQLLTLGDQLHHHLPRRPNPPPEREHRLDRVPHLLVRAQHDPILVVAIQTDRQRKAQLATFGLVAQPSVQPGADQMQLRLGHRALQAEQ